LDIKTMGPKTILEDTNFNGNTSNSDKINKSIVTSGSSSSSSNSSSKSSSSSSNKINTSNKSVDNSRMETKEEFLDQVSDPILSTLSEHSDQNLPIRSSILFPKSLKIPSDLSSLMYDPDFHQKLIQVETQTQTKIEIVSRGDSQELIIKDGSVAAIDLSLKLLEKHLDKYKKMAWLEAEKLILEQMQRSELIELPKPVLACGFSTTSKVRLNHDKASSNNHVNRKDSNLDNEGRICEETDNNESVEINNSEAEDSPSYDWDSDNIDNSHDQKNDGRCIRESLENADRNNDDIKRGISSVININDNHVTDISCTDKSRNDSWSCGSSSSDIEQSVISSFDKRNEAEVYTSFV
jgi:hypothetical protein